jgi:hypothetical protein
VCVVGYLKEICKIIPLTRGSSSSTRSGIIIIIIISSSSSSSSSSNNNSIRLMVEYKYKNNI